MFQPILISIISLLGCTALFGQTTNHLALAARTHLDAMMGFANEGMMIPEQIWDWRGTPGPEFRFGGGTGSATPSAWSMAQFIRLAVNLKVGHNSETPAVVKSRYANR